MPLNAQEFRKRSEELFAGIYLNSIGIIQSISLGMLAAKVYADNPHYSPQFVAQAVASFLAIAIIANEYTWWALLIRRMPSFLDNSIPYVLGITEFGVMAKVDDTEGAWFLASGVLAVVGVVSLYSNRQYAKAELFVECPWLLLLVRRNPLVGIGLIGLAAAILLGAWSLGTHLTTGWKIVAFAALCTIQIVMLVVTTIFMNGVRDRFEAE